MASFDCKSLVESFRKEMNLGAPAPVAATTPSRPSTFREIADAAMATDTKHRYYGVTADLHTLEQLAPLTLARDDSVPVIAPRDYALTRPINTVAEFQAAAKTALGGFGGLKWPEGLVMAGGAVQAILCGRRSVNDIDMFLVGHTQEKRAASAEEHADFCRLYNRSSKSDKEVRRLAAENAGRSTIDTVIEALGGLPAARARRDIDMLASQLAALDPKMVINRTVRCISFSSPGRKFPEVQVVLRLYASLSEVLHGFDWGSAAAGYDGRQVYFSSMGRLAFERGVNVLDPTRRRFTYELRAAKYFDRGFALVLPNLKRPVLDEKTCWTTIKMPYLEVNATAPLKEGGLEAYGLTPTRPDRAIKRDHGKTATPAAVPQAAATLSATVPQAAATLPATRAKSPDSDLDAKHVGIPALPTDGDPKAAEKKGAPAGEEERDWQGPEGSTYGAGLATLKPRVLAGRNFRAASEPAVKLSYLCARATYRSGMDIFSVPVKFAALKDEIARGFTKSAVHTGHLVRLVGRAVTERLAASHAAGTPIDFEGLARALAGAVRDRAAIPFRFQAPGDMTALLDPTRPTDAITLGAWYGEHYSA